MNATIWSTVAPPSERDGHAAERAPGEHQQDEVEADDLTGGEQARGDQPEQPRIHARIVAFPRRRGGPRLVRLWPKRDGRDPS